jgi:agmatinase
MRSESFGIETYSPYLNRDLEDVQIFDGGDLELPFGNPHKALAHIENYTAHILSDDKIPVMIGGEHLVTLGCIYAVYKKYDWDIYPNHIVNSSLIKLVNSSKDKSIS